MNHDEWHVNVWIDRSERGTMNQSTSPSWHAIHAINAGTACDLSTAGCPVDQVLDPTAPTGARMNQPMKSNQIKHTKVSEWMNEWMDGWMDEWMNEWVSEWVSEWVNEWASNSKWMIQSGMKWVNESKWMNEINAGQAEHDNSREL
jgi:hypothetical protein